MNAREYATKLVREMYMAGSIDSCETYRESASVRCALVAAEKLLNNSGSDTEIDFFKDVIKIIKTL